ncbi:MAG TPA: MBL fold metallo-hydrolase [Streptosporangiaceae bacterium]|nr:MBL fold metallo-hydrolase [Streptosporangiaceae bacterium]
MATELLLLGTAGAPLPVAGRAGISSALVVDGRVFVVDCGRGTPSGYAGAGLDFAHLTGVFLTHLHVDHVGDLAGLLLYPWGVRVSPDGPVPPVHVYGPGRPAQLPDGGADGLRRQTVIHPELPDPGTSDLVGHVLAGYAYHLNVMPLDAAMPDPAQLVRVTDIALDREPGHPAAPAVVLDGQGVRVSTVAVTHGHARPALAYRFDTPDGAVVFSGDTTVNDDLIALARGADILVHSVADLGYLARHGWAGAALDRMAGLHTDVTEVGGVAERAGVGELILTHYLPAEPGAVSEADWAGRAAHGFRGRVTAGRDGLRRAVPAPGAEPARAQ